MDTQVRLTTQPAVTKNRQPIRGAASAWSAALLLILAILVVYPVIMLLLGALTGGDPVIDGYKLSEASLDNFATVLANPNVHLALANSLIACTGGTAMAVVIGLAFAWIVVRTDTPCKGLIAAAGMLPLFKETVEELWRLTEADPAAEVTVDLVERRVTAQGVDVGFELDENSRWRLLEGLDDISITLRNESAITDFEARRPSYKPRTQAA